MFGDGKSSIRGGYGLAYERNFGNVTFNVIQNPPNYAVMSLFNNVDVPNLQITTNNAGPLAGTSPPTKVLPATSLRHVREDIVNAYAHFYSLAFQRELSRGNVLSVEYSGSRGEKLYSISPLNIQGSGAFYLGDADPNSRLNNVYSNINTRGNEGFSRYNALIVALDGMQDPGNAGTIVRSAEAFGASGVVLLEGSVRVPNGKFLRATAGSIFRLPLLESVTRTEFLEQVRSLGLPLYALTSRDGTSLRKANFRVPCALVVGGEGNGVSTELLGAASPLSIPARNVESLNAAIACSLALFEAARQRENGEGI